MSFDTLTVQFGMAENVASIKFCTLEAKIHLARIELATFSVLS